MRLLRVVGGALSLLVLLAALAVGAVLAGLATETGTRWALDRALPLLQAQGIELALGGSRGALLGRLELTGIDVTVAHNRVRAERLLLHWRPRSLLRGRLHLRAVELAGLDVTPAPAAEQEPAAVPQIPEIELPLTIELERLLLDGVVVRQEDGELAFERLALAADLKQGRLSVHGLAFSGLGLQVQGGLSLGLGLPHALGGDLRLAVDEDLTGPEVGPVAARLTLGGAALQPTLAIDVETPAVLAARARVDLAAPQPEFEFDADWPLLRWPLQGEDELVSLHQGRLRLEGSADDYRLTAVTGLAGPGLPQTGVDLQADGGLDGLRLAPLRLALLDGRADIEGTLDWAQAPGWNLRLAARELDPAGLVAELPGRLDAQIATDGTVTGAGDISARIEIEALDGTLRDYPVAASGLVELAGGELRLNAIEVASDANRVRIDGLLADNLDLQFDIDAPALQAAYPGLSGRLRGNGRVGGTAQQPTVVADLAGRQLQFEQVAIDTLDLGVDWRADGGNGRIVLRDGRVGTTPVARVEAGLDGTPQQHELALTVDSEALQATLRAAGGWQAPAWIGRLVSVQLEQPALGAWRLQQPVDLRLAADAASAGRLCLVQAPARLCAQGAWEAAGSVEANVDLRAFDLARLAPLLPGDSELSGQLAAEVQLGGRVDAPRLTFAVRPGDGVVRLVTEDETFEFPYQQAQVDGRFEDDRGEASIRLGIGDDGTADGRVTLGPALEGDPGARPLGGQLRAEFPDLALVSGFVPDLREVQGALRLRADLAGTLEQPKVKGELRVVDASARLPAAGIELSGIEFSAVSDGVGPVELQGQVRSGDGVLQIDGQVGLGDGEGLPVDLAVTGERFQAAQLPEARVYVSPDLRLTGSTDYRLTGTVSIPEANIEIQTVPTTAVRVSGDEIIVGDAPIDDPAAQAPPGVSGKVRVALGDEVNLEGFGLTTRLEGVLAVGFGPRGTEVDGSILLVDGRYQSFGQDLTIEQGRLLFAGPPDRPELDLRASRLSRDRTVTAYLAMSGPLTKPRPRIFSDPSLPEEEALAYLVTGRGLNQASEGEGFNIANAAFALGVGQGEPWLDSLSNRFGLDDLRIETGDNALEESSLVLGKYVDPRLYVGYTQELFNPEGALLVRLRLHEFLEVETRSGRNQSVDFMFRREHD